MLDWMLENMNNLEVTIVDYGSGNLLSVKRGFEYFGAKVIVTSNRETILQAKRVVLPGVGAFPNAMRKLDELNLISTIRNLPNLNIPLLGICLGMQLLLDESLEFGLTKGLGLIPGKVIRIPEFDANQRKLKIPQIGWKSVVRSDVTSNWKNTVLQDNKEGDDLYFVHSFMAIPKYKSQTIAEIKYGGIRIPAVIANNTTFGCQFHPEKSGPLGLKILGRFLLQ
jgi:glutamine amidotransferase